MRKESEASANRTIAFQFRPETHHQRGRTSKGETPGRLIWLVNKSQRARNRCHLSKDVHGPAELEEAETVPRGKRRNPAWTESHRRVTDDAGGVSGVEERKIPAGRGRVPCLRKAIVDFHVTRLPLKGLDV